MTVTPITAAVRVTETAISRRWLLLLAPLVVSLLAACGSSNSSGGNAFGWVHAGPAPGGWPVMRTSAGAVMGYPAGWRSLSGDRGTATRALLGSSGHILGYLNLTPRQGSETLADWAGFRLDHNQEEGDRHVTRLGSAHGLHVGGGSATCVRDRYDTALGTSYLEIACLVQGRRTGVVVVAAAPPDRWSAMSAALEQAINSLHA